MHDRQGMIQRREADCPCAEPPAFFEGTARDKLHHLHGPGIATSLVAYHVTHRTLSTMSAGIGLARNVK
jgi:hypothetical protein